jgi:prepilin-type N-terminal cleavage/methylation domain-containing protein
MNRRQRGFTLVEMLVAVAVLTVVLGVVFSQIMAVQKTYKSEEGKLDIVQETREFMDQFARDLHQAGFPNTRLYSSGLYDNTSQYVAAGIVQFSGSTIWLEGDVDGDGQVESVQYNVVAGANGGCPCMITRSMILKAPNVAPTAQAVGVNANPALRGLMNATPFVALDANGNALAAANVNQIDASTTKPTTYNVRAVRVTLNVQTRTPDLNGYSPRITMTSTAKVNTLLF